MKIKFLINLFVRRSLFVLLCVEKNKINIYLLRIRFIISRLFLLMKIENKYLTWTCRLNPRLMACEHFLCCVGFHRREK